MICIIASVCINRMKVEAIQQQTEFAEELKDVINVYKI